MSKSESHLPKSKSLDLEVGSTSSSAKGAAPTEDDGAFSVFDDPIPAQKKDSDTVISKQQPGAEEEQAGEFELGRFLEGKRLGHFELRNFVGGGGMGAVFRAVDTSLGRVVALKVLSRNQTDLESIRRFKIEAKSAARLDHDNIARVYFVGEDKGWNFIVFEYIEGENIRDLVQRSGRLSLGEAINYTLQIAEALEHAVSREVVHRDIKPSNIIVSSVGQAKLVDMGLARLQEETPATDLTASGVTLGTFDYISPEQARDPRSADVRSDLYSLGCTFYFMLTGRPPFPDGTVLQKLLNHSSEEPPDPRRWRPGLPEEVCKIISQMMAKSPANRFQAPSEVIGRLLILVDELGLAGVNRPKTVVVDTELPQPSVFERVAPWVISIVLLFGVLFGAEWYFLQNEGSSEGFLEVELAAMPNPKPPTEDDSPQTQPTEDIDSAETQDPQSPDPILAPELDQGETPKEPTDDSESFDSPTPPEITPSQPVEPPTQPNNAVVTTLVLGEDLVLKENEANATTLAEACKRAAASADITKIELRFNGPRETLPFDCTASQTVIVAGDGFAPELVFRPGGVENSTGQLIRLLGGRLDCTGIHLRAILPEAVDFQKEWAMFLLDNSSGLTLVDCKLTMENLDSFGGIKQYAASFVTLVAPLKTDSMTAPAMPAPPRIDLTRCIARGQAAFMRAEPATPFRIYWDEGLLATSERLVEFGGANAKHDLDGFIELDLNRITIAAERGLAAFRRNETAPFELGLKVTVKNSILITGPDAAIFEHQGVSSFENAKKRFAYTGENNFYPQSSILWNVVSNDPGESSISYDFDMARNESWFDEKFPHGMIMWKSGLPTNPVHQREASDYSLSTNPDNPALRDGGAGFSPDTLPVFPTKPLIPQKVEDEPPTGE